MQVMHVEQYMQKIPSKFLLKLDIQVHTVHEYIVGKVRDVNSFYFNFFVYYIALYNVLLSIAELVLCLL